MALSNYKTFIAGEVLTAADMNALQSHFTGNALTLISPLTGDLDFNGNAAIMDADGDLSLDESADDILAVKVGSTELFKFDLATASAVNGLTLAATATSNPPSITAHGSDTNINVSVVGKGTGGLRVTAGTQGILLDADPAGTGVDIDGAPLVIDADADSSIRATADDVLAVRLQAFDAFIFDGDVASPVNGLTFKSSATGVATSLEAQGSDSNIPINLVGKGTGGIQSNGKTLSKEFLGSVANVGGADMDIESILSTTYDEYEIRVEMLAGSDTHQLVMRTSDDNGSNYASSAGDYRYAANTLTDAGTAGTLVSGGTATAVVLSGADLESTSTALFFVHVLYVGDGSAGRTHLAWEGSYLTNGAVHKTIDGSGQRASTTRINAIRFLEAGGNNFIAAAYVYGIRKA